ncbi:hypothetical protein LguiB_009554 [Lonicera macranthoides]
MVNPTFSYIVLVLALIVLSKANASPYSVNLTRLHSAVAKGAVCLDGSPPAYHFDKGHGEGINNWLVHIEGGGWCDSLDGCSKRAKDPNLGSSNKMQSKGFYGILSNSKNDNPNFYNWNRILVRYCDGSSFTGDVDEKVYKGTKVYMRGARVFDAVMGDLLERGMKDASNAFLTGCSAGGLATILHCDKFEALLATKARVKCLSDGGYFLHAKDFYGGYHFEYAKFDKVVGVHLEYIFALTYLPKVGHSWMKCPNNTNYCSASQIKRLEGLQSEFVNTILTRLGNHPSSRGWFINSCYTHCQSLFGPSWLGPNVTLNDKTISEAVGDWFYDRRLVHLVDHKHKLPHSCAREK